MEKTCRIYDMGYKEVINLSNGARLGFIRDVEIDVEEGRVVALVIPGKLRFFGLLGREEDIVIPWDQIEQMGEDIIFVRSDNIKRLKAPKGK